jgi:hypothetical protein
MLGRLFLMGERYHLYHQRRLPPWDACMVECIPWHNTVKYVVLRLQSQFSLHSLVH